MDDNISDSRGRPRPREFRRAGRLPALLASIALLAAACGGSAAGAGAGAAAGRSTYQDALAFARCMRSHGEPGYPDPTREPDNEVAFKITPASRVSTRSAQYQSADTACRNRLPSSRTPITPALLQREMSALLKYTHCMRSHGIANFPDPVSNGKGISFPAMSGVDPGSPQFQSAQQACQALRPGGTGAP
jgi:hypothetical protein